MPSDSDMPTDENIERLRRLRTGESQSATDRDKEVEGLIIQIKDARRVVEEALSNLFVLSDTLKGQSRRHAADESLKQIMFANAHLRFAGAASQGLRRTLAFDRVLDRDKVEREELKRQEARDQERAKAREASKKVEQMVLPTEDAFDEVYAEVLDHAE